MIQKVLKAVLVSTLLHWAVYAGVTGKIAGVIIDAENGEPLAGVNVILVELQTGTAAAADGYYMVAHVPPGTYTLRASYIGRKTVEVVDVAVTIDHTTEINIEMEVSPLEAGEVITVTAERRLIQKDITSKRVVVSGDMIAERLPVSSLNEVLGMQAGIIRDESGGIHIRGGRTGEISYLIDGIYVRDPFNNSLGGSVDAEVIQEMEVISGTFNAEYGSAMSGVVNVVTKQGSDVLSGKFQYESPMLNASPYHKADWLLDTDLVKGLTETEAEKYRDAVVTEESESGYLPAGVRDTEYGKKYALIDVLGKFNGSLSGPIPLLPKGRFYIAGTFRNEDDYLPYGFDLERIVSSKFNYQLLPTMKIALNVDWSNRYYQDYDHQYKYWKYFDSVDIGSYPVLQDLKNRATFSWTHNLSKSTYYRLSLSRIYNEASRNIEAREVYYSSETGDLDSTTYLTRGYYQGAEGNFRNGDDRYWYRRHSTTLDADVDFVSQLNRNHLIKTGVEFRQHEIFRHRIGMPPRSRIEYFTYHPIEAAAYLQDKIELSFLIVNVGLRMDYFDPKAGYYPDPGQILQTVTDTAGQSSIVTVAREDVPPRVKWSPRIGLSHPISDATVLYFAYGHFFQVPRYYDLYRNSDLEDLLVNDALVGNPGLEPEETVAFEVGIKQKLSDDVALDLTAYLKDISNLVSSFYYFSGRDYTIFTNADFGRVQGIDVSLVKRHSNYFSGTLNYTFMIAKGNESDPIEGYSQYREESAHLKPNRDYYLDFDRRHDLSLNIDVVLPRNFGPRLGGIYPLANVSTNVLFRAASGLPYTPTSRDPDATVAPEKNSGRKGDTQQLDIRLNKRIAFGQTGSFNLYVRAENVLDRINVLRVWSRTGKPWDQGPTSNYSKDRQANPENVDIRRTIRAGLIIRF